MITAFAVPVLDFNVTFSEHCPLLLEFQSLYFHLAPACLRKAHSNCKWDDSRKAKFETNIGNVNNYRKRLSDTWLLVSMPLRSRLGHGQYLCLC